MMHSNAQLTYKFMYLYVYHIHKHLILIRDWKKIKFVKLEIKGLKAGILGKGIYIPKLI